MTLYIGLDLALTSDYTAIAIVDKGLTPKLDPAGRPSYPGYLLNLDTCNVTYDLVHLERYSLGTNSIEVVRKVKEMIGGPAFFNRDYQILPDSTGMGRPIVDQLRLAKLHLIPIVITAGSEETNKDGFCHVPKRELISNISIMLDNHELRADKFLPNRQILIDELKAFKLKISLAGNDTYEAWRNEGAHDDLVLAAAMAAYWAKRHGHAGELGKQIVTNPWLKVPGI